MMGSAAPAVYATLDPSNKGTTITLSNGNLTETGTSGIAGLVISTVGKSSGKWYWEATIQNNTNSMVGVAKSGVNLNGYLGVDANGWGWNGSTVTNNASNISLASAFSLGSVIGFALDMDAGTLDFYRNGTLVGTGATGLTGTVYAAFGKTLISAAPRVLCNFGATALTYSPPSGYNAGLYA